MSQDQIDLFGAIGAQSRINAGAGLVPVPAAAIPTKRLRAGGIDPAAVRPAHVAPSGTAWLEQELDRFTRQHARFLREVAPPAPPQRRRIALREWQWRLGTDADDFAALNGGTGDWQTVTVPHYAGPLGRATTWYRREIQLDREWFTGSAPWLVLRGVDYRAIVYLNGAAAATHEGAFAPIEVDGRRWLKPGRNVLLIQVENDLVSTGNDSWGSPLDGPKLYAATGPGFDDPDQGWRHCPPGMGIWQEAFVEARPDPHIADIFVRVLDHTGQIEAWIEIHRAAAATGPVNLELEVHGLNHRAVRVVRLKHRPTTPAGPGPTQYRIPLTIPRAKSWTPAEPWLYRCDVRLVDEAGASLDAASRAFGLRTFVLDQTRLPRNRPLHVPGWARLPESGNYHHFWYESPRGLAAWVEASQRHQAWAVLTVADAMRRQNRLVSCAVHLLIDNFPSGMMFALVDVERQPKLAFFALREAFAPLALSWRSDRTGYYAGEPLAAELWLADDTGEPPATVQVRWRLRVAGKVVIAQHFTATPQALKATALGLLAAKAPAVDAPQDAVLEAELIIGGKGVQSCSQPFRIWPRPATIRTRIGTPGGAGPARRLVAELGLPSVTCGAAKAGDTILVDSPEVLKKHSKALLAAAERGARVVVLGLPIGNHEILGHQLEIVEAGFGLRHFVSRDTGHPWVAGLAPGDIRLWHDGSAGRITPLLDKLILPADGWQPVLISGCGGWGMILSLAYACAERPLGKGHLVICQVDLAGRTATNPAARTLADALLGAPNPFINPT